jgi:hypothetical protein
MKRAQIADHCNSDGDLVLEAEFGLGPISQYCIRVG